LTAMQSRCMPLGIDEADLDDWLIAQDLDSLSFKGAEQLLDYLSKLPVSRQMSQAHIPMHATKIIVNTRKAKCWLCDQPVSAGQGFLALHDNAWQTYHASDNCPCVTTLPELRWDTERLRADLEAFCTTLHRDEVVLVDEALIELSQATDGTTPIDLEDGHALLPYQRAGVAYALTTRRVLITDSMGLGKTAMACAIALDAKNKKYTTLIVVPASLRIQVMREFHKFAPSLKVASVTGRDHRSIPKSDVLVISDSIITHWQNRLVNKFQYLIVDEAHSVKNEKAQRTRAVNMIARTIPQDGLIALMSGTITPNRPSELVSPLKIIGRLESVFTSRTNFLRRYCDYQIVGNYPSARGATNIMELNRTLRGTCMVRRTKENVLKDLPPKRVANIDLELSASAMSVYRKAEDDFLAWILMEYGVMAWERASKAQVITRMTKLREILGEAKVSAVVEHVESLLAEGESVVLFGWHTKVLQEYRDKLAEHKPVVVKGGMTAEAKDSAVQKFTSGKTKLFIGQYISAGQGLNLADTCSHVVLAEMCWSPAELQQAIDRVYRYGQKKPVVAWVMTAVDTERPTIDSRIWKILNSKAEVTSAVLDGWAETLNADAGSVTALVIKEMIEGV